MDLRSSHQIKQQRQKNPFVIKEGKFKDAALEDSFYSLDWAEDSFLSGNHEKEMLRRTFDLSKLKYIIGFMIFLFLILFLRLFWLQIVKRDYYYSMAEGNRVKEEKIEPKRGIIYDRNLNPLVANEANFILYFVPSDLPKDELARDEILRRLSSIIENKANSNVPQTAVGGLELYADSALFYEIKAKLDEIKQGSLEAYRPLFIKDNLEYDVAIKLYLEAQKIPGVYISNKIRRNYLLDIEASSTELLDNRTLSLSHILGYTGKINQKELETLGSEYSLIDYLGKTGLEYQYEKELKGVAGQRNIEVNALGQEKKIISQSQPQDGFNLLLSLDAKLQSQIENLLSSYLKKNGLKRASVILMDPRNGEIITLISWPAYDNNIFSRGIKQEDYQKMISDPNRPLFNRAISGEFPSGSTIKIIFSAGALEEKIITAATTFMSTGGLRVGQWFFPDWKAGGHGLTNVKKAIAESVNTFYYYIGGGYDKFKGMGIEKLGYYAKLFGLGEESGLDLPNEASGFFPTPEWKEETKNEVWYIGDTYHAAIGQGDVTVTPLQVANYTSVFANGGKLYKPHLVKKTLRADNQEEKNIEGEIIRENFISSQNIEIVREGMRQTVISGSGRFLSDLPVPVAGKTGTAQWSSRKNHQAWFTGFAPYDNPELVVTVLLEEGGEGSSVAVPLAKEIFKLYFTKE